MPSDSLTVEEVLYHAEMLDRNLETFDLTAPRTVADLGGRDGLARASEMTCIGPIPRLPQDVWEAMSAEYEGTRANGSMNRGV